MSHSADCDARPSRRYQLHLEERRPYQFVVERHEVPFQRRLTYWTFNRGRSQIVHRSQSNHQPTCCKCKTPRRNGTRQCSSSVLRVRQNQTDPVIGLSGARRIKRLPIHPGRAGHSKNRTVSERKSLALISSYLQIVKDEWLDVPLSQFLVQFEILRWLRRRATEINLLKSESNPTEKNRQENFHE